MTVDVVVMEPTDDCVVKPAARYKPSTVPFSFILSHYSKRLELGVYLKRVGTR